MSLPALAAELVEELVIANKILYKYGVVDGFGHISVRHDADPQNFFVMSHHLAPPLVTANDLVTFDLEGEPVDGVPGRRYYSERFIHSEIYKLRPDVVSVVHSHALSLLPFAATKVKLRPMYHMSAFLAKGPPVFDIRKKAGITNMLVRTPELGNALAEKLGPAPVVLMRGHGATMVGASIRAAVYRSIYAMQNAIAQLDAIRLAGDDVTYLDPREAEAYDRYSEEVMHRPWNMWRAEALGEIYVPKTLRIGAIGLGRAAANMIPAIAGHPHVKLTAAADPNPEARARFESDFGGRAFTDAEALCASGEIDAVYIATPHGNHAPDVIVAAAHGKHAIVEKPMALTLDECRAMTAAARNAGTVLIVGHTHAFDPPHALMGQLIRSGEFGRLRTIVNLVYGNFLYRPRRPEELDSSLGGGIMYNQVPHQVEILRTLATAPVRTVQAVTGVWDPARRTEGALAAFVTFADGAVAQLTYSGYDHFDSNELAFWVSEGGEEVASDRHGTARRALRAADPETERKMRVASGFAGGGAVRGKTAMHEQHFGFLLASCERADLRPARDGVLIYADDGVREIAVPRGRVYPNKDAVIDEFYDAVVNGVRPVHDGEWGTTTTAVALALVESARDGRVVTLAT